MQREARRRSAKPPLETPGGFLSNRWSKIGVALVVVGWSPLTLIVALAAIGLWPDPNPNPIGPGLLFFVTFWPALICLGVGGYQTRRRR